MKQAEIPKCISLILDPTEDNPWQETNREEVVIVPSVQVKVIAALTILTILSMLTCIFIVYFTASDEIQSCHNQYQMTFVNSIDHDAHPRSVAVDHLNLDDVLDVVVINSATNTISIFFGLLNSTFLDPINYSTGIKSNPYSMTIGDINKDLASDIIIANFGTHTILILLNDGHGDFSNQMTISTGLSRPFYIVSGYINNDLQLDLVVINYGTHDIDIYLGYGNGTFTSVMKYFLGNDALPFALVLADFNRDQHPDLAIVNHGTNELVVLVGNANGTFCCSITYTLPNTQPCSIAVADFNNDQQLDLVIANNRTNSMSIFFGDANGTFTIQTNVALPTMSYSQFTTTGDFNGDHHIDILSIDIINGLLHILPGRGNGLFSNMSTYISENQSQPIAAAVADFDHDNRTDIALVHYGNNYLKIFYQYSSELSSRQTSIFAGHHSHPSSLAIGDFNGDQHLDIVFTEASANNVSILFGSGEGTFTTKLSYSAGIDSAPMAVAIGNLNHDQYLDIVVVNYGMHTVSILPGIGNGSFATRVTYSTGFMSYPTAVALGDFNHDQAIDIAVSNFRSDEIAILLNDGDGNFGPVVTYSTGMGSDPTALVAADFNGDQRIDLAVTNSANNNIGIFLGLGDGTFQTMLIYHLINRFQPDSIVVDDFNGDHLLDIVVADSTSDNIAILISIGPCLFAKPVLYSHRTFANPSALAIADLNDDHLLDIIVTNFGADNVVILAGLGNGAFNFNRTYQLTMGAGPEAVVVGNFNKNIRQDIVVVETGLSNIHLLVDYVAAKFDRQITYSLGRANHPYSIAIADINQDNHLDIIVANSGTDNIGVFLGYGNGTMMTESLFSAGINARPQYVTVGDLNNDQYIDIVTANTLNDSISLFRGFENGRFAEPIIYHMGINSRPVWVTLGDLNHDRQSDIVIANSNQDHIAVLLSYTYRSFHAQQTYEHQLSMKPSSVITADVNHDTFPDIVATFALSDCIGLLFSEGNGTFSDFVMYSTGEGSFPNEVISNDMNNDRIIDIIVTNTGTNSIGIFLGYGNGTFTSVQTYSTGNDSDPFSVAVGDLNNDNRMDVVVANYRGNSIGILFSDENRRYDPVILYPLFDGSRPTSIVVADLNADSLLDIVVTCSRQDNIAIFLNHGNGIFNTPILYSTGYLSLPTSVIVVDLNHDDLLDIAVTNKFIDNVGILYNTGNRTFHPIVFHSTGEGSRPHCIRSGDFNNDKRLDIAVVNSGTNVFNILYGREIGGFLLGPAQSTGQNSGPISLAVNDLNHDGWLDITTANYLIDTIGVHLNEDKRYFGSKIVSSTGFQSNPSAIAISDFNGDTHSDVVVANSGTSSISIMFGDGNGNFDNSIIYSTGFNSDPVEVVIADFNHDNQSDIVVVNSNGNNVYIFLGHGNGHFSLITIYSTGLNSRPYGITVGDLNNDSMLDLIIVTAGTNQILLVTGYGNGTFGNQTSYPMNYNFDPYAVVTADFNEDGRLDIAVANYGGNIVAILLKDCE